MDRRSLLFVIALTVALFFVNQWFFPSKQTAPLPPSQEKPIETFQEPIPHAIAELPPQLKSGKEHFYVLENQWQQLVFSNLGGAIAQINLPFKDKKHPESPVLPIGFDRILEKTSPPNATFPGMPYYKNEGNGVQLIDEEKLGHYYPLLRRGIFSLTGVLNAPANGRHYALNTFFAGEEKEPLLFSLKRLDQESIEFEYADDHRRILKSYRFAPVAKNAPYCIDVTIKVEGDARNLWISTGVPEVELISDNAAPSLKYLMQKANGKKDVQQISLPKETAVFSSITPEWVSNSNGFFGLILDPLREIAPGFQANRIPGALDPTRLVLIDPEHQKFPADKYPGYEILLPLRSQTMQFRLYAGPYEDDILKAVDAAYADPSQGYSPRYIQAMSFHGWFTFISEPFARFLFILMKFFYQVTSSWGFSIILLTVALRVMLYPLNAWSIKSTLKMQKIAPKVAQIQEKYKKDPKRSQMEIMTLYKEQGVNPLSGCFPLLIQLPFLIGMFDLLKSTFELRGASFIPGWIDNLTAPDVVFSWNYPVLFFGNSFHLLPILLGAVMWAQQRFSSSQPKDPKLMTDQQKQQRSMGNIMTLVFAVMFYHFPSGLNIYWLSSMGLGILQQWVMARRITQK